MSEDKSMCLVNLGELSKPANTFIEKVSSAVGGIFRPWQIERVAKAEAKADLIRAESEIQITDLHRRAMQRFVEEEAVRQKNMEAITEKAIPHIQEQADPSKMDDDWIANFFDKSRIVSDSEMQDLWAKVLAGEANQPSSFSKRTVNFLSDLDKIDAEQFQKLCRFGWYIDEFTPVIFDSENEIYKNHGITFDVLTHLDSIGLIRFEPLSQLVRVVPRKLLPSFSASYYDKPLELTLKGQKEKSLPFGQVLLTSIGMELVRVVDAQSIPEFYDYAKDQWKEYLPQENDDENKDHNDEGSEGAPRA